MLDFGYVGLESKVQYMRVEIDQGKVRVHFTFWERAHEVTREMSTSRVKVRSEEFVSFLNEIAEYLLSGDDRLLLWYIEEDKRLESTANDEPQLLSFT